MASSHQKNRENLYLICGEKLQKSKGAVTSKFQFLKWKELLAEKFSTLLKRTFGKFIDIIINIVPVTWVTHYDDDCKSLFTCRRI